MNKWYYFWAKLPLGMISLLSFPFMGHWKIYLSIIGVGLIGLIFQVICYFMMLKDMKQNKEKIT